jgi:hypothetical protein
MKVAIYVSAFICFGLGAAFMFLATHSTDSTYAALDTAILGGVGAMFLLGTFLLVRR